MRELSKRLRKVERQAEARKPVPPILVLLPGHDAAARLAEFRRVHGCEPFRIFNVKRASARKEGKQDAPPK